MKGKSRSRLLLTLIAMSLQLHAVERWVPYRTAGPMDKYIDSGSVRVANGVTSYRVLFNFQRNSYSTVGSIVFLNEIICGKKLARFVRSASYSEPYGQGKVVSEMNAAKFGGDIGKFLPIESEIENQFQVVCPK